MRLLILLAIMVPILALSKDKKENGHIVVKPEIHCFNYNSAMDNLKNKYGEEPVFIGKSDMETGTATIMFINQESGSYTVITTDRNVACILDVGRDVIYRLPAALQSKMM